MHAPFLRKLECKHNPSLRLVRLRSRNWAQINKEGSSATLDRSYFYKGSYFPHPGGIRAGLYGLLDHLTEFTDGVLAFSNHYHREVELRDAHTGLLKQTLKLDRDVLALLALEESRLLYSTAAKVKILDRSTGNLLFTIPAGGAVRLAYMPKDKLVTVAGKQMKVWDFQSGSVIDVIEEKEEILCVAIDGESLVYATSRKINKWEDRKKTLLVSNSAKKEKPKYFIKNFAIRKDGKLVIQTGCATTVFDIKTHTKLWTNYECKDYYHPKVKTCSAYTLLDFPPVILSDDVVVYVSRVKRDAYSYITRNGNKISVPKIEDFFNSIF